MYLRYRKEVQIQIYMTDWLNSRIKTVSPQRSTYYWVFQKKYSLRDPQEIFHSMHPQDINRFITLFSSDNLIRYLPKDL